MVSNCHRKCQRSNKKSASSDSSKKAASVPNLLADQAKKSFPSTPHRSSDVGSSSSQALAVKASPPPPPPPPSAPPPPPPPPPPPMLKGSFSTGNVNIGNGRLKRSKDMAPLYRALMSRVCRNLFGSEKENSSEAPPQENKCQGAHHWARG